MGKKRKIIIIVTFWLTNVYSHYCGIFLAWSVFQESVIFESESREAPRKEFARDTILFYSQRTHTHYFLM